MLFFKKVIGQSPWGVVAYLHPLTDYAQKNKKQKMEVIDLLFSKKVL